MFAGLALAAAVAAQTYPSKPVSMIVAFPPGGGSDVLGRAVGKGMADVFGQPVIVENVVGVGGSLGVLKATNAQPDGYTLLAGSPLELIYTPLGVAAAKNKPEDMRLAALVGHTPIAIAVRKDLPVNTLDEFAAFAKKADKPLSYGSTGMGSLYHLMAEKALQTAGARGLHAPYNGMAPALNDLLGGQVIGFFADVPAVMAQIKGGKLRALGMASKTRHPLLQDVKTFEEQGFKSVDTNNWYGFFVSSKTSPDMIKTLNRAIQQAVADPAANAKLTQSGAEPKTTTPEELGAILAADTDKWARLIKARNITAD